MSSLFTPLEKEGYTSLKIHYDYRNDHVELIVKKEWENDFAFEHYNKDFFIDSILTSSSSQLSHQEVEALYHKYNLTTYLDEVIQLVRKGRHIAIECYFHAKKNIRFICNQHSRVQGLNNRYFATLAGGIRRHPLEEAEIEVIKDGLNLGRAMSLKNVVAGVPFGGVKTTVHMDSLDLKDYDALGFLAFCMDRCKTFTSPDMNFPVEMSDIINERYSVQYIGGRQMPLGTTGKPTAYGLYIALKQVAKFRYGNESLAKKSIVLQGLGEVGWFVAQHLLEEDVKLSVSDINLELIQKLKDQYPDRDIKVIDPKDVYETKADIFCPCAMGAIFDKEVISKLNYEIVFGAANNQIKATSDEEEIEIAKAFAQRDILFQTDFVNNSAGVICGAASYIYGEHADYDKLLKQIDEVLPSVTWKNFVEAKEKGITPTENIYHHCKAILYK